MNLKKQALSGAFWTTSSTAVGGLIQILRLSILTRFLEKSDFGLVAIVVLVLGFTHIFSDLGVSTALFSKQNITKNEYSTLFWVGIILGCILYLLLILFTPIIAQVYRMPELKQLIPIMGWDIIIRAVGRQFRVFREKALRFKSLALIDISSLLFSLGIAFWLAMKGAGVYSLIFSALFSSLLATILLVLTGWKHHPLKMYINIREGRAFYKIGFYQTGTQIVDYFASQLDILIIGGIMPAGELGVYNLVKQLVLKVYGFVNPIISTVSVPLLAKFQNDHTSLKGKYLEMIKLIAFANFWIYGMIALLAKEVLFIFYGSSYQSSAPILQVLCIWGGLSAVGSIASTIVIIMGRTDLGFKWTLIRILPRSAFILVGALYGILGIVIAQSIFSILFFSVYWYVIIRRLMSNITFIDYISRTIPFMLYSILTFFFLFILWKLVLSYEGMLWGNIFLLGTLFSVIYLLINRETLLRFIQYVRKR